MLRANRRWMSSVAVLLASAAVGVAADPEPGTVVRGTVVDEAGRPVAGATVDLLARQSRDVEPVRMEIVRVGPVRTGPDGGFVLRHDRILRSIGTIRAMADGGERLGISTSQGRDPSQPIRLVLSPSRSLTVRVVDAAGKPVAGAGVEVSTEEVASGSATAAVDPGTTDDRGIARFRVPADATIRDVLALKEGAGADYLANERGLPAVARGPLPAEVSLTLKGARTVAVRALDSDERPIPGVVFRLSLMTLKGRPTLRSAPQITEVTTDASGIARWRWVPEGCAGDLLVVPMQGLVEDALPRLSPSDEGDVTLNALFRRRARLSGRVVHADGSPARGVAIRAQGLNKFGDKPGAGGTRTGEDGSYVMLVRPEQAYLIAVTGPDSAAEPRSDLLIGEGERHDGLDFRLIEGTRLHGRVAIRPGAQRYVVVDLLGEELPADQQRTPGAKERLRLPIPPTLDGRGGYEARLGPGEYEVFAADHPEHPTIHIGGSGEFVLNFLGDLTPPPVPLKGVVVEAAPGGGERPAKSASLAARADQSTIYRAQADEAGRFSIQRTDQDVGLYASGEGGVAAVKVAKGVGEVKVVLGPPAAASGRVVDAAGRPFVGEGPFLSMSGGPWRPAEHLRRPSSVQVRSGPGRRIPGPLSPASGIQGVYFVLFRDSGAREVLPIKTFRVPGPGPIDLGTFVIPAGRP